MLSVAAHSPSFFLVAASSSSLGLVTRILTFPPRLFITETACSQAGTIQTQTCVEQVSITVWGRKVSKDRPDFQIMTH